MKPKTRRSEHPRKFPNFPERNSKKYENSHAPAMRIRRSTQNVCERQKFLCKSLTFGVEPNARV